MTSASNAIPYGAQPPSSWRVVPLKYLAALHNGYVFRSDDWVVSGTPIIRIENLNGSEGFNRSSLTLSEKHHVNPGDLLFSWSGNPGTSFGPFRWEKPGLHYLNQHIFKVSVQGCAKNWLYWSLRAATHWIERELTSGMIGMVHVTKEDLNNVPIPIPVQDEQHRISEFLDAEIAHVDRLIEAQRRVSAKLAERRVAGVIAAVAGAHYSDQRASGLAWSSTLPKHWNEVRVGLVAHMGSGHTPSRSHPEWWVDCTIPWITTGEVSQIRDDRREKLTETRERISQLGLENSSAELCPAGTVVLSRTASAGYSAVMGGDMATSQDFVTWVCGPRLNPYYLLWCLRAMRQDLLGRLAMGSTHKTIYVPDLQTLRIPLPDLVEQHRIVEEIRDQNLKIDQLVDAVERQTVLLAERRQALITAAVTGQLDVTTARPTYDRDL